ncbi:hypothetical protein C4D60_Mb08t11160 [Musa balbisiana]|uniref:Uncharacterized protein n=1 Tax=Musa balbisiana TaxID=52838 RepID=A0A4S8K323_MUSBA|nr:hypothetical protein C4D60_Mb08t11160 [Musa balbisiana]
MFCYRPLNFLPRIRWRGRRAFLRALCLRSSSKNSSLWRRRRRAFLRALCLHSSVDRINPVFFCSGMASVGDSSRRVSYSRPHLGWLAGWLAPTWIWLRRSEKGSQKEKISKPFIYSESITGRIGSGVVIIYWLKIWKRLVLFAMLAKVLTALTEKEHILLICQEHPEGSMRTLFGNCSLENTWYVLIN